MATGTGDTTQDRAAWFDPGVAGIGTASLLADAGHEIPTALLPSLLTTTLGAPASALGVIEGVSDALAGVARLGGGALADDPHRRRAIAVGYTTTAVLSAGIGACATTLQVAVLRAGAWTARGLRVPARNALPADIVPLVPYGRAYGFERAMDNLGAIIGPLLAVILVGAIGTRWAIGLSVIPGLLAALAIIFAIRHTAAPRARQRQPIRLQIQPVLRGQLGRLMLGITAFEVGNCAATLLILRATELFEVGRSPEQAAQLAILLYVGYNFAATAVSVPPAATARPVYWPPAPLDSPPPPSGSLGPDAIAAIAPASILAGIGIGCATTGLLDASARRRGRRRHGSMTIDRARAIDRHGPSCWRSRELRQEAWATGLLATTRHLAIVAGVASGGGASQYGLRGLSRSGRVGPRRFSA